MLNLRPNDFGHDVARGEHGVTGFDLPPIVETDVDRGAAAIERERIGFEQLGTATKRDGVHVTRVQNAPRRFVFTWT